MECHKKEKEFFFFGSKKNFSLEDPEKTHFNPENEDLFNSKLKPYETVGDHIKEFSNNKYKEDSENAEEGTYYKELTRVMPGKKLFIFM